MILYDPGKGIKRRLYIGRRERGTRTGLCANIIHVVRAVGLIVRNGQRMSLSFLKVGDVLDCK